MANNNALLSMKHPNEAIMLIWWLELLQLGWVVQGATAAAPQLIQVLCWIALFG
jgi:hypothetical protein